MKNLHYEAARRIDVTVRAAGGVSRICLRLLLSLASKTLRRPHPKVQVGRSCHLPADRTLLAGRSCHHGTSAVSHLAPPFPGTPSSVVATSRVKSGCARSVR